jgi:hypothetical protein
MTESHKYFCEACLAEPGELCFDVDAQTPLPSNAFHWIRGGWSTTLLNTGEVDKDGSPILLVLEN